MKNKIGELEGQVMELRITANTKINGEEVREIIDRKLNLLQEYKRDTEQLNKKCADISMQMRNNIMHQADST